MKRKLAFVLSGGGAHGAAQVGALGALLEAGLHPDMLVGTSIGAINSAFLALKGINLKGVLDLTHIWMSAMTVAPEFMPNNYLWLSVRAMLGRPEHTPIKGFREFFTACGISKETRFRDVEGVELYLVAADLNNARTVLFGDNLDDLLLDGVLASSALPPWMQPIKVDGMYLVDGGFISNLPVEAALSHGATEIIALDLADPLATQNPGDGTKVFFSKAMYTVILRQRELELALAEARGVPTLDIVLCEGIQSAMWDFSRTTELIDSGYELTRRALLDWQSKDIPGFKHSLPGTDTRVVRK